MLFGHQKWVVGALGSEVSQNETEFTRVMHVLDYPEHLSRKYSLSVLLEPPIDFSDFLAESEKNYGTTLSRTVSSQTSRTI